MNNTGQHKYIVGLTGGIGSGKSSAAAVFAGQGIEVVDADQAARRVVQPGSAALARIAERFGTAFLHADGSLRRAELRAAIFARREQRRWLEELLHPLIHAELAQRLRAVTSPYGILMAPLLLESPRHLPIHRILVIDTPEALQQQRVMARDASSAQEVRAIMDTQLPRAERLAQADDVLCNEHDKAALATAVEQLHERYLRLALQHARAHGGA